jgi:hypothetical protein
MNDPQQATQLTLFAPQLPHWAALPQEARQAIVEALAQMLLQAVAAKPESHTATNSEQGTPS